MTLQQKLAALEQMKNDIEKDILEDRTLSISKKLSILEKYGVYEYDACIFHVFADWYKENTEEEKRQGIAAGETYHCTIVDEVHLGDRGRYEKISFPSLLEDYFLKNDPNKEFVVLVNRGKFNTKTSKTAKEIAEKIFEVCCKHKIVGCYLDW